MADWTVKMMLRLFSPFHKQKSTTTDVWAVGDFAPTAFYLILPASLRPDIGGHGLRRKLVSLGCLWKSLSTQAVESKVVGFKSL